MNRLIAQRHRLFGALDAGRGLPVRALLLELRAPADWGRLGEVWRGVQAELGLPAPAIAVSGSDGLQLWFSLREPVEAGQAHAFLAGLRQRYLQGVPAHRSRLLPSADPALDVWPPVPAEQPGGERWSAFVAPDLVPLFEETPWLDMPPGDEAQAGLLAGLEPITPAAWAAALEQLAPGPVEPAGAPAVAGPTTPPAPDRADARRPLAPRDFLLSVMNDPAVPLALRIEAAKALLDAPGR